MVANGKLHSLQKIIFFSCWRLGNTVFALLEYRAFSKAVCCLFLYFCWPFYYLDKFVTNRQ